MFSSRRICERSPASCSAKDRCDEWGTKGSIALVGVNERKGNSSLRWLTQPDATSPGITVNGSHAMPRISIRDFFFLIAFYPLLTCTVQLLKCHAVGDDHQLCIARCSRPRRSVVRENAVMHTP